MLRSRDVSRIRKSMPPDGAAIAGDVLIQLLHSGFAGRSGRR